MPVLLKVFRSRLCSNLRGDQSGMRTGSVASLRGGHLALRLASTVLGFGASTSSIAMADSGWGQASVAGSLPGHAPPALSGSLVTRSGSFWCLGQCTTLHRSYSAASAPSPGFKHVKHCGVLDCLPAASGVCSVCAGHCGVSGHSHSASGAPYLGFECACCIASCHSGSASSAPSLGLEYAQHCTVSHCSGSASGALSPGFVHA